MGKRRQPRTSLAAPVRMRIVDQSSEPRLLTACTLDASPDGCRIYSEALQPGQIVELQYGASRSRFRVVWVSGQQAGLTSLDGKQLFRHLQQVVGHVDNDTTGKVLLVSVTA